MIKQHDFVNKNTALQHHKIINKFEMRFQIPMLLPLLLRKTTCF